MYQPFSQGLSQFQPTAADLLIANRTMAVFNLEAAINACTAAAVPLTLDESTYVVRVLVDMKLQLFGNAFATAMPGFAAGPASGSAFEAASLLLSAVWACTAADLFPGDKSVQRNMERIAYRAEGRTTTALGVDQHSHSFAAQSSLFP